MFFCPSGQKNKRSALNKKIPYYTSGFRRLFFTSGALAERLHPPSHKATADKQAAGATSSTFAQGYGGQASKSFVFL